MSHRVSLRAAHGGFFLLAAVVATQLAVVACRSENVPTAPTPDAGERANDGGGNPDPQVAACKAYMLAQCDRSAACNGEDAAAASCTAFTDLCPDFYFSPGSTRTVEDLYACADETKTIACDRYLAGVRATRCGPGIRKAGEPCRFGSQCASEACSTTLRTGECGSCRAVAEGDTSCGGDAICPSGFTCSDDARCKPTEALVHPGNACTPSTCLAPSTCLSETPDASTGTCGSLPGVGEACRYVPTLGSQQGLCGPDALCATKTGKCIPLAKVGEACGYDLVNETFVKCDSSSSCPNPSSFATSRCSPRKKTGEACGDDRDCVGDAPCLDGKCGTVPKAGERCEASLDGGVTRFLSCAFPGECANLDDAGYHCIDSTNGAGLGDACDVPTTPCRPYLDCIANTCQHRDLTACENAHDL